MSLGSGTGGSIGRARPFLRTRWRWVLGSSPGASVLCPRTALADRQLRGGTVCVCARLPNEPPSLSLALCAGADRARQTAESPQPDTAHSRPTPKPRAKRAGICCSRRDSRVSTAFQLPICLSAICRTEQRPMAADTPDRIDIALLQGLLGVCPARPAPCVLSALTPGPGPGVTPGHAGRRLPAAADPTHTGQTPTPAGHAGHAQPRPRR